MNKLNIVLVVIIIICAVFSSFLVLSAEPQELYSVSGDVGGLHVEFLSNNDTSDCYVEESGDGYVYYFADEACVNVYVAEIGSKLANDMAYTLSYETYNPQNINGTLVYMSYSNQGDRSGEVRYMAVNENQDTGIVYAVSTPNINETVFVFNNLEVVQ